jgi:hypothetical protein
MKSTTVHINELRLRASGLTPEQARHFGKVVAERLAQSPLAMHRSRKIPALNVCVKPAAGKSLERAADDIVDGIRRRLVESEQ